MRFTGARDDHVLHGRAHFLVLFGDRTWRLNLIQVLIADEVDRLLRLNALDNLRHVEGAGNENLPVVGGVREEGSEAERRLRVQTHEDWLASLPGGHLDVEERAVRNVAGRLTVVVFPKLHAFVGHLATRQRRSLLSALVTLVQGGARVILRKTKRGKLWYGVDEGVLVLDDAANAAMSRLNYLCQTWEGAGLERVTRVQTFKFRDQLVHVLHSGFSIVVHLGSGREDQSLCPGVLQGMLQRVDALLF